jgi:hypothetical protein
MAPQANSGTNQKPNLEKAMSSKLILASATGLLGVAAFLVFGMNGDAQASNKVVVYKAASCGCCQSWIDHMEAAGFEVEVHNMANVTPVKDEQGVYRELRSCHTALVAGYVIEGHVPAENVTQMLAERPEIRGLAVPGMPIGSPGMEQGSPANYQDYNVVAFDNAGNMSVYAQVKAKP